MWLLSFSPLSLSSYDSLISCDLLLGFLYMLVKIPSVCSLSLSSISLFLWQPDKLWSIAGISLHVSKDSFDLLSISSLSLFLWQPDKQTMWFIAGISLHVTKRFLWFALYLLSLSSYGSLISCDLLLGFLYMLLKIPVVCSLSLLYLPLPMAAW